MFVLPVRRLKRGLVPDVLDLDLRPPGDSASRLVSVYFLSSVFSNGELELWSSVSVSRSGLDVTCLKSIILSS